MVDRHAKRFRKGRQRPLYHMEQESWDEANPNEQQEDDWEEGLEPGAISESDWGSLAFEQRKSFPHCTTPFCKEKT